jgi:hypothetical protein
MEADMAADLERPERLQIMLNAEELAAVDDFRFQKRMPSRAAAVRELMRRGLTATGFSAAAAGEKSANFGVLGSSASDARNGSRAQDSSDPPGEADGQSRRQPAASRSRS